MAKTIVKSAKASVRKAKPGMVPIVKVNQTILEKLKALNLEPQLQSDIAWCLGSFSYDNNPIGLYEAAFKALAIFKAEHARKTKGITVKLISEIEKVLTTK